MESTSTSIPVLTRTFLLDVDQARGGDKIFLVTGPLPAEAETSRDHVVYDLYWSEGLFSLTCC